MTGLRTTLLIAGREIRVRGRSRVFRITTVLLAVVLSGVAALPTIIDALSDEEDGAGPAETFTVGVIGELGSVEEAALAFTTESFEGTPEITAIDDPEAAREALLARDVRVVVDAGDGILARQTTVFSDGDAFVALLADTIGRLRALDEAGLPLDVATSTLAFEPVDIEQVAEGDIEETGRRSGLAYIGLIFIYTTLLMYGSWIVNGVIEEKSNRVVELLLSTVRPRELMAGKVLGLGALGIGQILVIVLPVLAVSSAVTESLLPAGSAPILLGIAGWWVLGYLFFSVVMAAAGSLVSRPEEAQVVITPVTLLVVVSFFAAIISLEDPDGTVAVVTSFVPITAPLVMTVRTTLQAAAWWEVLAAVAIVLASAAGMTVVAGRIYTGGILRTGGRTRLRQAWRGAEP